MVMAVLTLVVQFIIALPKIWTIIQGVVSSINEANKKKREAAHETAKENLDKAKTRKETKDAANKYLDTLD